MIRAIMFDLDGTLLPINEKDFIKSYFSLLYKKVEHLGYQKEELMKMIWMGITKMINNDGKEYNEKIFWDFFKQIYGDRVIKDKEVFDDFYLNEFKLLKEVCNENVYARKIVDYCNENFDYVILATNPFFPRNATLTRMEFVGLNENDFDYISTYENSKYCKPNSSYYKELLEKFNLRSDEVIMIGNNVKEDYYAASSIGIKTYLVGDYIINDDNLDSPKIYKMEDVIDLIRTC